MTEPTAEALTWLERERELSAKGVITGAREICRACLRPMVVGWSYNTVPVCVCGAIPLEGAGYSHHGLDGIPSEPQTGTITYG